MGKIALSAAAALVLAIAATGCFGGGSSSPHGSVAACRAAWKAEDIKIGDAIMSGSTPPALHRPAACDGLSDRTIAEIHAKLMSSGY